MNEPVTVAADPTTAIVMFLVLVVFMLMVIFVRRGQPAPAPASTTAQLASIETRLTEVEKKVDVTEKSMHAMERALSALPTQQSVHDLEKKVIEIGGEMKAVAQATHATGLGVNRIEEFLLKASVDAIVSNRNSDGLQPR